MLDTARTDRELLTVCGRSLEFFKLAIPTMISCLFLFLTFTINTAFAGMLDDPAKLAGVGLGTTFLNILCFEILMGMNGAVETLVSQAYGANHIRLCGVYLNRGRAINIAFFIPLAVILCFSK